MKIFYKDTNRIISQTAIIAMIFGFSAGVVGQIVSDVYINPWQLDYSVNANQDISEIPELRDVKRFVGTQQDLEVNKAVAKISPAVAGIYYRKAASASAISRIYLPGDLLASGIILTADGWLVTYSPALTPAKKELLAVNVGDKVYKVSDMVVDATTGAIFMKLSDAVFLPVAALGDSTETTPGQIGVAVNSLKETAVIGNLNPNYSALDSAGSLIRTSEKYYKSMQLSGSIKASLLGGPLVNLNGEVTGLVKEAGDSKKLAAAIPINQLRPVLADIFRQKNINRPYLGISYIDLSNALGIDAGLSNERSRGALVYQNPKADSPAAAAGLKANDIIIGIDGRQLSEINSLSSLVMEYRIGDKLNFEIIRDGKTSNIEVTLAEAP